MVWGYSTTNKRGANLDGSVRVDGSDIIVLRNIRSTRELLVPSLGGQVVLDFKPPRERTFIIRAARMMLPFLLRRFHKVVQIDVDEASLATIRQTDGAPAVFAPNHPGHPDPGVMFWVSAQSRRMFRYMSARETFGIRGLLKMRGFLMQSLGAYSVIRGAAE
jgi:1-acyl-sn-glycerol-3-phosphate acyltransferase